MSWRRWPWFRLRSTALVVKRVKGSGENGLEGERDLRRQRNVGYRSRNLPLSFLVFCPPRSLVITVGGIYSECKDEHWERGI